MAQNQLEDLQNLITKWNGDIEKLDHLARSKVFLEVYKDLAIIMKRDFDYEITANIVEITLLNEETKKEEPKKEEEIKEQIEKENVNPDSQKKE